jgi:hypothetical protein
MLLKEGSLFCLASGTPRGSRSTKPRGRHRRRPTGSCACPLRSPGRACPFRSFFMMVVLLLLNAAQSDHSWEIHCPVEAATQGGGGGGGVCSGPPTAIKLARASRNSTRTHASKRQRGWSPLILSPKGGYMDRGHGASPRQQPHPQSLIPKVLSSGRASQRQVHTRAGEHFNRKGCQLRG